jgi:hypothetical protein
MEQRPAEVFVTALASLGLLKITKEQGGGNKVNDKPT